MFEIRVKTFGGAYRSFIKDLGDMMIMTSSSKREDNKSNMDYWKGVQDLESRIIEALEELQKQEFFQYMEIKYHKHQFWRHWLIFEELASRWDLDVTQGNWERLGMLLEQRDWKGDGFVLERVYRKLESAEPKKGHERDLEWTEEYRTDACSKGANQEPRCTTIISENRTPTFGGAFRMLIKNLDLLTHLMDYCIRNKTLETTNNEYQRIRNQEILIRKAVENLSCEKEILEKMVIGLYTSEDRFKHHWKCLQALSSEWEESSTNINNPATHIDDEKWEMDCDTLIEIQRNLRRAYPSSARDDAEWIDEYRADASITRSGRFPITFYGAFQELLSDLGTIEQLTNSMDMEILAKKGGNEYWSEIRSKETRIKDNVPKFSEHPFFPHMTIYMAKLLPSHERFMAEWEKLVKLSQQWENTKFIWEKPDTIFKARDWEGDRIVLREVRRQLESAKPKDFIMSSEWRESHLPTSKAMKQNYFRYYK